MSLRDDSEGVDEPVEKKSGSVPRKNPQPSRKNQRDGGRNIVSLVQLKHPFQGTMIVLMILQRVASL